MDSNKNKSKREIYDLSKSTILRRSLIGENGNNLRKASYDLTKFLKDKNVKTLVAIDKSGRPAGWLISQVYRKIYPDGEQLKTFFINPEELDSIDLKENNNLLYKHLLKNPEEPIAVLDEHASTGRTITNVKYYLKDSGFKKVYTAALTVPNDIEEPEKILDFSGGVYVPPYWRGSRSVGVEEFDGRTYAKFSKEVPQSRRELTQLAEEIKEEHSKKKLENILEKVVIIISLAMIVTGMAFWYPGLTGNVVAQNSKTFISGGFTLFFIGILGVFLANKK